MPSINSDNVPLLTFFTYPNCFILSLDLVVCLSFFAVRQRPFFPPRSTHYVPWFLYFT